MGGTYEEGREDDDPQEGGTRDAGQLDERENRGGGDADHQDRADRVARIPGTHSQHLCPNPSLSLNREVAHQRERTSDACAPLSSAAR